VTLPLQLHMPSSLIYVLRSLSVGAAVRLQGSWVPCQGRGQSHELQVSQTTVLGPSDAKVRLIMI
jgi:aspartyl/asparaginyl-tRNA synthetase